MKIGVLADTHIPVIADKIPDKIIEHFREVELILHAGDLVEPEVLANLKELGEVKAVCGNMDSPKLRRVLPVKEIIKVGKFNIGLIHGWGHPELLKENVVKEFKNVDVIVYGHSHSPVNEVLDGVLFFNPGSPTDKTFAPYNSYGVLEITDVIKGEIIKL